MTEHFPAPYRIERVCHFSDVWRIVDHLDEPLADGFSSKDHAEMWAEARGVEIAK